MNNDSPSPATPSEAECPAADGDFLPERPAVDEEAATPPNKDRSRPSSDCPRSGPDRYSGASPDTSSEGSPAEADPDPVYSVFTHGEKIAITLMVSFLALVSPLSGQIYLPALSSLSEDLGVSTSAINLSITTYMIFQGITPSFLGNFSDVYGRRPTYLISFAIFTLATLGLALQHSYPALMVLRCFQSMGSSATVSLASACVADLSTRAERGAYMGYAALGVTLGPALGPVAGGLLTARWGWQGTFWFLFALSALLLALLLVFLPETGRMVVGDGSVPPPWWDRSLYQEIVRRRRTQTQAQAPLTRDARDALLLRHSAGRPRLRRPNPLAALAILLEREGGITLGYGALIAAGYFMLITTLSELLAAPRRPSAAAAAGETSGRYGFGFSPVIVGVCFLPLGLGSLVARTSVGRLLDWNFRRWARRSGTAVVDRARQQRVDGDRAVPIERARLEITLACVYTACAAVVAYGWALQQGTLHAGAGGRAGALAGVEVTLFLVGLGAAGVMNGISTLVVDTHPAAPATAVAANNLFRCLLSAGATAGALPLVHRIGVGFTAVCIAGVWLATSPLLWLVLFRGAAWRAQQLEAEKRKAAAAKADHEKSQETAV